MEICKHVFAECRKLIKDFTHLNFLFMMVRLHTLLRASLTLSQGTDPKAQANGYSHAYLDPETAQVKSLVVFPSDKEIEIAAGQAWEEAISLLSLVGIESDDINNPKSGSQASGNTVSDAREEPSGEHNYQDESDHRPEDSYEEDSDAAQLQCLIGVQEVKDWRTVDGPLQEKMHVLTCVAMALEINNMEAL